MKVNRNPCQNNPTVAGFGNARNKYHIFKICKLWRFATHLILLSFLLDIVGWKSSNHICCFNFELRFAFVADSSKHVIPSAGKHKEILVPEKHQNFTTTANTVIGTLNTRILSVNVIDSGLPFLVASFLWRIKQKTSIEIQNYKNYTLTHPWNGLGI